MATDTTSQQDIEITLRSKDGKAHAMTTDDTGNLYMDGVLVGGGSHYPDITDVLFNSQVQITGSGGLLVTNGSFGVVQNISATGSHGLFISGASNGIDLGNGDNVRTNRTGMNGGNQLDDGIDGTAYFGQDPTATTSVTIGGTQKAVNIGGISYPTRFQTHYQGANAQIDIGIGHHSDAPFNGGNLYILRSRGTEAVKTVVQDGDDLGTIYVLGFDGTTYIPALTMDTTVTGTPASGSIPCTTTFTFNGTEVLDLTDTGISVRVPLVLFPQTISSKFDAHNTALRLTVQATGSGNNEFEIVDTNNKSIFTIYGRTGADIPAITTYNNTIDDGINGNMVAKGTVQNAGIINNMAQTTTYGDSGTYGVWSMPEQGSAYKKVAIRLFGFISAGGRAFTFPTAFTSTPFVYGDSAATAIATTTKNDVTFTSALAVSGWVFIEGY